MSAVRGLSNPMKRATNGVQIITPMDFTRPTATLREMTSDPAPRAEPVTGPTMKVAAPAPSVVMLTASR